MINRFDRDDQGGPGRGDWRGDPERSWRQSYAQGNWDDRDEGGYRASEGPTGRRRDFEGRSEGRYSPGAEAAGRNWSGLAGEGRVERAPGGHGFERGPWQRRGEPYAYGNYGNGPWGAQQEGRWGQGDAGSFQGGRPYGESSERSGRPERWGMGNTSDESDRFRQGSESRSWRGQEGSSAGGWSDGAGASRWQGWGQPGQGGFRPNRDRWSGAERGQYFGKGPKGYRRSDERIKEDVSERLSLGHVDASEIEVQVKDGEVTLSGTVPAREMRRLAEEMVENLSGVLDVTNQIRVKRDDQLSEKTPAYAETARRSATTGTQPHQRS